MGKFEVGNTVMVLYKKDQFETGGLWARLTCEYTPAQAAAHIALGGGDLVVAWCALEDEVTMFRHPAWKPYIYGGERGWKKLDRRRKTRFFTYEYVREAREDEWD